ncbi:hypothetical protein pb186bvf_015142 [Paramecium bursaria]
MLKLEQYSLPPKTPVAKDLHHLSVIYNNPNSKSHSIDRSFYTHAPTRKSVKLSSANIAKSDNSRVSYCQQSSPLSLKSFKNSLFSDVPLSVSPKEGNNLNEIGKLMRENNQLKEKLELKERQIESLLKGSLLKQLQLQVDQLKSEKQILQHQLQNTVTQLARELEMYKKSSVQLEKQLCEEINQLKLEVEKYKSQVFKLQEFERSMKGVILENEQLKHQRQEDVKWQSQIQEQLEMYFEKTQEQKLKMIDCKHYAFLVLQISQYLTLKQSPPLEFLVQLSKLQKQVRQEHQENKIQQGSSLKMMFAQVFSTQVEILVMLNQINKDLQIQVERFSKQYVSEVGMQLVSR